LIATSLGDIELPAGAWLVTLALAVMLLIALLGWWRAATRLSRRNRVRQRAARKAESQAERLLERHGFKILDRQLVTSWLLQVDGESEEVTSRVDLLVERGGRVYVADVKSGGQAPDPRRPATRRQMLEYLLAFDADGALVVDMSCREIRSVAFPGLLG
jgi:membrane protein implicated in regulation of membrane protease activity